jgi:hypothetical protein
MPHSNPQITDCGIASSRRVASVDVPGKPRPAKLTFFSDGVINSRRAEPKTGMTPPCLYCQP